jgi:hypothetical protein
VVTVRALARQAVRENEADDDAGEPPEPQEKPEPNLRITLPSPFPAPLAAAASTSVVESPYVSASFLAQPDAPAVGSTKTESPPDTNGAVGRDRLMVTLNSNYAIERKSDGKVLSKVSMDAFWRAVGARAPFDPRVLYDRYSDRWLLSAGDSPLEPTSLILYGISDSGDPLGSWHLYALRSDAAGATWADFPTLGYSRTTVAIGVNMFARESLTYVRGRLIVLDYDSLRAGGAGKPLEVTVPDGFALQPAVTYSPTETTLYLVEHLGSFSATYRFWSLSDGKLTLVDGAPKTNPLGPWATSGPGNFLPQQDGRGIDSGDSRVGNAVFRNGHVYYAQTIGMPPSPGAGFVLRTGVQWVELDTSGNFVQGGRLDDRLALPWNGRHMYAFPSLAVNARNDLLLGFSEFQSSDFVDAGYAFRAGTDPPGTLRTPVTLKDGEGPPLRQDRGRGAKPLGRLQRDRGRPGGRPLALDNPGVRAPARRPRRRPGPLGHVVGPRRRRAAAVSTPVRRPGLGREAVSRGLARHRARALPARHRAPGQVEAARPRAPSEPARGQAAPCRLARQPDRRPLGRDLSDGTA